jgi:hypothetical protein
MAVVASKVLTPSIYPSINHLYPKLNMALVEAPILRAWVTSRAILQDGNISKKICNLYIGAMDRDSKRSIPEIRRWTGRRKNETVLKLLPIS